VDIILLGAPGAGKGTQADLLVQWLGVPRVSSGDLFRAAIQNDTELGAEAQVYLDKGELVPDSVTIAMVAERLQQPDCALGVILDGFPRTVNQALALGGFLGSVGRQIDLVLYISVSEDSLLQRLAGRWTCRNCGTAYHELFSPEKVKGICDACGGELYQRTDDMPETQKRRIKVYMEQTAPLIDYYRQQGTLVEIDGEQSIQAVQDDTREAIEMAKWPGSSPTR
jgi:adenylate kinase